MSEPAETSAPPPRWPWLDRWFEPPWRALLTWVVLAALTGWALEHNGWETVGKIVNFVLNQMDRVLPMRIPVVMRQVVRSGNFLILVFWFEPIVFRLNLPRGLVWVVLRIIPFVVVDVFLRHHFAEELALLVLAWAAMAVLVLSGWRSRPWITMCGGAWMAFVASGSYFVRAEIHGEIWWWNIVMTFPYAAVLLYGTRRLPR